MEDNKKELKTIDVINIAKKLWARKKLFAKTLPIAFVLSCVFILGFPRYYNTDIKLAPELGGSSIGSSTLGSLASSFGFDLDNLQSNDAITPLLYPDLMEDNGFVTNLFNVRVKTVDGSIETTYHDYLQKHQKPVIWIVPIDWMKNLFRSKQKAEERTIDPYNLSKDEDAIAGSIRSEAPRAVIAIGCNEGEFPPQPSAVGIFTDSERRFLREESPEDQRLPLYESIFGNSLKE